MVRHKRSLGILTLAFALVTLAFALVAGAGSAEAQGKRRQELVPRFDGPQVIEKLRGGGHVILLRHMTTERTPDNLMGVDLDDCSTQRILSEAGRAQAVQLGKAYAKLGVQIDRVFVSPYCRCVETGQLAFGKGEVSDTLSVWDDLPMEEKTARGTAIRKMLDTPPPKPGTNTVLVTHTGNLLWSFGLDSRPEGIAHVFKPTGLDIGRPTYLGFITPSDWPPVAADPSVATEAPAAP